MSMYYSDILNCTDIILKYLFNEHGKLDFQPSMHKTRNSLQLRILCLIPIHILNSYYDTYTHDSSPSGLSVFENLILESEVSGSGGSLLITKIDFQQDSAPGHSAKILIRVFLVEIFISYLRMNSLYRDLHYNKACSLE